MKNPKISLLISTYNWPEALNTCLRSAINQSEVPDEIIITDDGSKKETRTLIENYQKKTDIPIIHEWQENNGFRLARVRNLGIARAKYPYLVIIDGDLVLHKHYIKDQKRNARFNFFIQGTRVITPPEMKDQILKDETFQFSLFAKNIKNRKNLIHSNFLSEIASYNTKSMTSIRGIRGCNMSFWKQDLITVNGFNENFEGWGREDTELVARLFNAGMGRRNVKFNCLTAHIYHNERNKENVGKNHKLYLEAEKNKTITCDKGLDQHL